MNAIKKATLDEFASANSGVSLEKRLNDLRKFLKVATEGGSIDFARTTLGKSLFVFMKVSQVIYSYFSDHTILVGFVTYYRYLTFLFGNTMVAYYGNSPHT